MKTRAVLMLILFLVLADSTAYARKWTDKSGRFSTEAELVQVKDKIVTLKKPDGRVLSIPIEKLSDADRDYLESLPEKTAPALKPDETLPMVTGKEPYELVVKWARTEVKPIAISRLPDVLFRSRDGQAIDRVFYAFEMDAIDLAANDVVTKRHVADQAIPIAASEGVIPMSDGPRLPPNAFPPSAGMDLVLRTVSGLKGTGELRVAFFRDSKGKQQVSDWLKIPVDLSK